MNLKVLLGVINTAIVGVLIFALTSCGDERPTQEDALVYLKEVHKCDSTDLQTDSFALYVDYSTCVSEAVRTNSPFFQKIRPTLVSRSNKPIYFSIKGDTIRREFGDAYDLLKGVVEINNANIEKAANMIAQGNRQAVLITDGEYWDAADGNRNKPYLETAILDWISAGRDVYIYAESYKEPSVFFADSTFNKNRYYIIFTDDRIENNLNRRLEDNVGGGLEAMKVKKLHLTARAPLAKDLDIADKVAGNAEVMMFDRIASSETSKKNNLPILFFTEELGNIAANLKMEEKRTPFVQGISISTDDYSLFKMKEYDIHLYDLSKQTVDYVQALTDAQEQAEKAAEEEDDFEEGEGGKVIEEPEETPAPEIVINTDWNEIYDVFDLKYNSDETFDIYFKEGAESALEGKLLTLMRLDIVVKDAENQLQEDGKVYDMLTWKSISTLANGQLNTSLFDSVNQAVINGKDKGAYPTAKGRNNVYTFYIYTNSN